MRPARKRKLVDTIKADWKVSIRRACSVLKVDRSLYVYKSRRGEKGGYFGNPDVYACFLYFTSIVKSGMKYEPG